MVVLVSLCIIAGVLYGLMVLAFNKGWRTMDSFSTESPSPDVPISVICAVRNESKNISRLLKDLLHQNYPVKLYEIILIDDHSQDDTWKKMEAINLTAENMLLIKNPGSGKKAAIREGIKHAGGEMVLLTDGDCRMGRNWLKAHAQFFTHNKPSMTAAPVFIHPGRWLHGLEGLEFASLMATAAGASGLRRPVMVNGANLALNRLALAAVENLEEDRTPSGDDIFMLQQLKKQARKDIRFLKNRDAMVYTPGSVSFRHFFNQRIRWASKSRYYQDRDMVVTGLLVFLFNACLAGLLLCGIFNAVYFLYYAAGIVLKLILDLPLLYSFLQYYGKTGLFRGLVPVIVVYPLYVVVMAVLSMIVPYHWKGRIYQKQKKAFRNRRL